VNHAAWGRFLGLFSLAIALLSAASCMSMLLGVYALMVPVCGLLIGWLGYQVNLDDSRSPALQTEQLQQSQSRLPLIGILANVVVFLLMASLYWFVHNFWGP
jgi:hypothetical protein